MAAVPLCQFRSQARGIRFYDVPMSSVCAGVTFTCELEPTSHYDSNCIALMVGSSSKLGHLAKEDASVLASLLREGFAARG
jgi:hypothetical protein